MTSLQAIDPSILFFILIFILTPVIYLLVDWTNRRKILMDLSSILDSDSWSLAGFVTVTLAGRYQGEPVVFSLSAQDNSEVSGTTAKSFTVRLNASSPWQFHLIKAGKMMSFAKKIKHPVFKIFQGYEIHLDQPYLYTGENRESFETWARQTRPSEMIRHLMVDRKIGSLGYEGQMLIVGIANYKKEQLMPANVRSLLNEMAQVAAELPDKQIKTSV